MFAASFVLIGLLSTILLCPTPVRAHDPSAFGGLFRSRDGGVTWFPANAGRIISGAIALAVNPVDSNHLLLATDSGLLRSRNAGLDWSSEAPSVLVGAVFAVAFDRDGRRALASTDTALLRNDSGETWHAGTAPACSSPTAPAVCILSAGTISMRATIGRGRGRLSPRRCPERRSATSSSRVAPALSTPSPATGCRRWTIG